MASKKVSKKAKHPDHHPELIIYIMLGIIVGGLGLILFQQLDVDRQDLSILLEEASYGDIATPLNHVVANENIELRHNRESPVVISYYNQDMLTCSEEGAWFHLNCQDVVWDKIIFTESQASVGASNPIGGFFVTTNTPGSYLCQLEVYCGMRSVSSISTGVPDADDLAFFKETSLVHQEPVFIQVLP